MGEVEGEVGAIREHLHHCTDLLFDACGAESISSRLQYVGKRDEAACMKRFGEVNKCSAGCLGGELPMVGFELGDGGGEQWPVTSPTRDLSYSLS